MKWSVSGLMRLFLVMMALNMVAILVLLAAFSLPSDFTIYEDGSYLTYSGHEGCLPFAICQEGN